VQDRFLLVGLCLVSISGITGVDKAEPQTEGTRGRQRKIILVSANYPVLLIQPACIFTMTGKIQLLD